MAGNYDSYIEIDNTDGKLSYGPSISFFIWLYHTKNYCPILEYGEPGHTHPDGALHFHTYWSNIKGLYFGLSEGSVPNPWYGVNNIINENTWNHVGFTFDDATKVFK